MTTDETKAGVSADETTPVMMSLDDFCEAEETTGGGGQLRVIRIGGDASFVGFFAREGVPIAAHYLEEAEGWEAGYVRCTGPDCPACKVGLQVSRMLLMPVVDLATGEIALLRVPATKGPGKLLTEVSKVLALPEPDKVIAVITREGRYTHHIEVRPAPEHDPETVRLVQRFRDRIAAGDVDLAASVPEIQAVELAEHPRIARKLKLTGGGK